MNKTRIEWCDMTFNPVTGCLNSCPYCYARKSASRLNGNFCIRHEKLCCLSDLASEKIINPEKSNGRILLVQRNPMFELVGPITLKNKTAPYPFGFEPTFHRYRLNEPQKIKKTQNIFVCSMADMFGDWVPDEWIAEVFKACEAAPQHNYLFLTKNPKAYKRVAPPATENIWLGTTVNNNADLGTRGFDLFTVMQGMTDNVKSFLSIEPLQQSLDRGTFSIDISHLCHFDWVIIGAETGNRKDKIIPEKGWIDEIVNTCEKHGVPVFMKDSLVPIVGEANMRREFPEGLKKGEK